MIFRTVSPYVCTTNSEIVLLIGIASQVGADPVNLDPLYV